MVRRASAVVFLAVSAGFVVSGQQQAPAPMFKAGATLVTQVVVVNDSQGRPVRGLTAQDFVLTEDGRPQTVVFAEYEEIDQQVLPSLVQSAVSVPAPLAAVTSSQRVPESPASAEASQYQNKRLLVFYFDVVSMGFFDINRAFDGAMQYIDKHMTAGDMVSVRTFAGRGVNVHLDFTADREALVREIDRLRLILSDPDGTFGSIDSGAAAFGEDTGTFNLFVVDRQLSALQTAVTDLGTVPQVKTLLYFGAGLGAAGLENLAQLRATVNAAVRAHVTLNPVDARGLVAVAPMGNASQPSRGGIGMFSGSIAQNLVSSADRARDTLYSMARDTGGQALFDNNDLALSVVDAASRVTGYYILGYYPDNRATDGKYRRIRVSLANGAKGELSYRSGYYGAKEYAAFNAFDRERQLSEALRFEDPITDIPIAMELHYFRISEAEYFVPISVRMPGSDFARARPGGASRVVIDVVSEIKDEHGTTMRNLRDRVEFGLDALETDRVAARPLQYETGFSLLPGNYVIKMLARDTTTGRLGTYVREFSVPNLARMQDRLPTSSVLLTQQRVASREALFTVRQQIPADVANPLYDQGQRLVPSVTRTFNPERPLHVFLEAYPGDTGPLAALVSFYRDGALVHEAEVAAVDSAPSPPRAAVAVRVSVSLAALPPGNYTCQVTVLQPSSNRATFWRAPIAVAAARY